MSLANFFLKLPVPLKDKVPDDFICWFMICGGVNIRGACASGTLTFRMIEFDKLESWQNNFQYMTLDTDEADTYQYRGSVGLMKTQYIPIAEGLDYLKDTIERLTLTVSYEQLKAKIRDYWVKWNSTKNPAEIERLNIELSRLLRILENTKDYTVEHQKKMDQWIKENDNANREAFETISFELKTMNEDELKQKLERRPELRFLLQSKEQNQNEDFTVLSTSHLTISEARAVYYSLPTFEYSDYSLQYQFFENLMERINQLHKPITNPIEPKNRKKFNNKPNPDGSDIKNCFEELLKKRRKRL